MKSALQAAALFVLLGSMLAQAQLPTFQHIILVVQENRTPDNLFGGNTTFEPGVDLQNASDAQPWCLGACFDPNHENFSWQDQYKKGSCANTVGTKYCSTSTCNGVIMSLPACPQDTYVSTTFDNSVISPYFDIAEKYGFANYFFQTNEGPSQPAHDFLFGGTSAPTGDPSQQYFNYFGANNPTGGKGATGCEAVSTQRVQLINPDSNYKDKTFPVDVKLYPCFEHQTLSDLLEANNKTWKYYTNNYGDIWTAPNGINHICVAQGGSTGQPCANPDFTSHVLNSPKQVLSDIASPACALQNMSWVIPNGTWSDHPGLAKGKPSTTIEGGPNWVASIINTLGASTCTDTINGNPVPYWQDTAIIVVWDDWGGFYDHIAPFKVQTGTKGSCDTWGCGYTYGFRVPLLVVSAYTPASYVSGDTRTQGENFPYVHDFGSILGFVENNFGIPIGSINVQEGYPFADAFAPDYSAQPLNVPLADFFSLTSPRQFEQIQTGANSFNLNYFLNYSGPPVDPDNDVIDND